MPNKAAKTPPIISRIMSIHTFQAIHAIINISMSSMIPRFSSIQELIRLTQPSLSVNLSCVPVP
jgi:hypothetical protein